MITAPKSCQNSLEYIYSLVLLAKSFFIVPVNCMYTACNSARNIAWTICKCCKSCYRERVLKCKPGNTKGGSITVPLTSCLTGLGPAIWQLTIFVFICKTDQSKPVKQEVNSTVILPPIVFPGLGNGFLIVFYNPTHKINFLNTFFFSKRFIYTSGLYCKSFTIVIYGLS